MDDQTADDPDRLVWVEIDPEKAASAFCMSSGNNLSRRNREFLDGMRDAIRAGEFKVIKDSAGMTFLGTPEECAAHIEADLALRRHRRALQAVMLAQRTPGTWKEVREIIERLNRKYPPSRKR